MPALARLWGVLPKVLPGLRAPSCNLSCCTSFFVWRGLGSSPCWHLHLCDMGVLPFYQLILIVFSNLQTLPSGYCCDLKCLGCCVQRLTCWVAAPLASIVAREPLRPSDCVWHLHSSSACAPCLAELPLYYLVDWLLRRLGSQSSRK